MSVAASLPDRTKDELKSAIRRVIGRVLDLDFNTGYNGEPGGYVISFYHPTVDEPVPELLAAIDLHMLDVADMHRDVAPRRMSRDGKYWTFRVGDMWISKRKRR
ncbi:MAG: hypothetical protein MPK62_00710 [Alphaproteobacteria bacterium]|nr:hypothetical protein [Alphaproteobacteria bacterium]